ncbi:MULTISPECIES: hypothetical protein [Crateriforma]|nr:MULTISPECIES: hypothetical protein [Crateriforma]
MCTIRMTAINPTSDRWRFATVIFLMVTIVSGASGDPPSSGFAPVNVSSNWTTMTDDKEFVATEAAPETKESLADSDRLQQRLAELRKPAQDIRLDSRPILEDVPTNVAALQQDQEPERYWASPHYPTPIASRVHEPFCHQPLYFQEVALERCGDHCGYFQNAVSTWRFVFNTTVLPYRLATQPHCRCVTSWGDCRCCQQERFPAVEPLQRRDDGHLQCRGVAAEAAVAGFTFLLLM